MSKELSKVEYQSISGIQVELDADTVIKYCARGNGNITPQEVALFLRTCQAKRLDPLENGEVYLIKYDNTKPAQIVVGKHAYLRRADRNPEYRGKKSGIVIVRDGKVIQKEGCCLYKVLNETLIGGWCRVFRRRAGADVDEEFYREVALEEYSSGQANWKVKPATMIEKVAVSQCLRDAFPNDYEGLYSEDEMLASGAIPAEYTVVEDGDAPAPEPPPEDPVISVKQREALFELARNHFDADVVNDVVRSIISEFGLNSTKGMTTSVYNQIMDRLKETIENLSDDAPGSEGGPGSDQDP